MQYCLKAANYLYSENEYSDFNHKIKQALQWILENVMATFGAK